MSAFDPKNWWGSIPKVAEYTPTDFGAEQLKAIKDNISAFPQIQQLGSIFQDYMTGAYEKAIPGFSELLAKGGAVTGTLLDKAGDWAAGRLDAATIGNIQRSSAYQNLGSGLMGSAAGAANAARNLGLGSLELIQKGAGLLGEAGNAAQRWMGLASNLVMNPSGMLVTPQQQAALTMQNNLYKQATQQRKFNMEAMPDPMARGIHDTVINLIGAYLGKGGGGSTAPPQTNYFASQGMAENAASAEAGIQYDWSSQDFTAGGAGSGSTWDVDKNVFNF